MPRRNCRLHWPPAFATRVHLTAASGPALDGDLDLDFTYDYVIVGGGSAGCLLANRLSKDPDTSVLLVEAGGLDDYLWLHIPVGYLYCIGNPRTDWLYRTAEEAGLNGRSLLYPRGRVLGGCSSINGMIYMRGQKRDYDAWAALGNPGWNWDEVLPLFLATESHHSLDAPGTSDPLHGRNGEWRVEKQRLSWQILDAFRDAAVAAGIPATNDFNRGDNFGVGYFEVNQRRGVRWNAAKAFLHPLHNRKDPRENLTVVTEAQVEELLFDEDGRTCTGIRFSQRGETHTVSARAETILSAGSVGSTQLLELAGIGDPAVLGPLGIPVRHALPGVGANLQDHLQLRMAFKVSNVTTLNTQYHSLFGKAMMGLRYLWDRSGPLSMAPSQLGAFARSSAEEDTPDLEYHVQPLSLDAFGQPLHRFPAFTASVCHLRPSSRGSIHVTSRDPRAAPRIAPNYLSTEHDRKVAAAAIRLTRAIAGQAPLAPYQPEEFRPGAGLTTDEELARAAGDIGTTIFHPVGTCKMGPASDATAVVDGTLRVHGIGRLRVVDASVMPTITSGNTNAPTMMIAEKAARMILAGR